MLEKAENIPHQVLFDALQRLERAARLRDGTLGDLSDLLEKQGELKAAAKNAWDILHGEEE